MIIDKKSLQKFWDVNKSFVYLTDKIARDDFEQHELLIWDQVAENTCKFLELMRKDIEPLIKDLKNKPN